MGYIHPGFYGICQKIIIQIVHTKMKIKIIRLSTFLVRSKVGNYYKSLFKLNNLKFTKIQNKFIITS